MVIIMKLPAGRPNLGKRKAVGGAREAHLFPKVVTSLPFLEKEEERGW